MPEDPGTEQSPALREVAHDPVPVIVSRDEYLDAVAAIESGHGPIAVDAERASGFRYSQRAYLIQIYRRGAGTFLFDPPLIGDFGELQQVIGPIEWVLHAASQDLACLREVGLDPELIFDTELGARLLGLPRVGLGTVVADLLGIHLAKEHSAADWSTRPLPQKWLDYAALDVEFLVDLRDTLAERLDAAGKSTIALQEFAAVRDRAEKPIAAEPWRRLSGLHTLRSARALAVARDLWLARDQLGRATDIAPSRLIPDRAILAVAHAMPTNRSELLSLAEFTGRASRSSLDVWWPAVERGMATSDLPELRVRSTTLPPPRSWSERNPEADARLKNARAAVVERAEQLELPVENLLSPEALRLLAWNPPSPVTDATIAAGLRGLGARPWQVENTAELITQAFIDASRPPIET